MADKKLFGLGLGLGLGLGEGESSSPKLRHLGFVRTMAIQVLMFWGHVYNSAKQHSGLLKPIWEAFEQVIATVLGPLYNLVVEVPDDILVFMDLKLDGHIYLFEKYMPSFIQKVTNKIHDLNVKILEVIQKFIGNIYTLGLHGAFSNALSDLKKLFENEAWEFLNWLRGQPVIKKLEEILLPYLLPLAIQWGEKYNKFVKFMTDIGFSIFGRLPLVPVEALKAAWELQKAAEAALHPFDGKGKDLIPSPSLPIPSLPVPSLPAPSLPVPSLPVPSLPVPSLPAPSLPSPSPPSRSPSPSLPMPSLPIPSLPMPSLPIPSLPMPSLPMPSLPMPSLPMPSLPIPSLPIPSLPIPSLPTPSLPNPLEQQKKKEGLPFVNPLEALKEKDNPAFM